MVSGKERGREKENLGNLGKTKPVSQAVRDEW